MIVTGTSVLTVTGGRGDGVLVITTTVVKVLVSVFVRVTGTVTTFEAVLEVVYTTGTWSVVALAH